MYKRGESKGDMIIDTLPSRGDDLEVKARGVLEVALTVGLGLI